VLFAASGRGSADYFSIVFLDNFTHYPDALQVAGKDRRGQMPDRRMIDKRPKVVNERQRIGDWKGDTVEGRKGRGFIATHVERKPQYTVAVKVADKSAQAVTQATIAAMKKLRPEKVKTMTFDNGKEFAGFKELEKEL
jgi:transposase, IS30 family